MYKPASKSQIQAVANTIRGLSIDAIQKANSGHPGLPLGCADLGSLLYTSLLKHDPSDPAWIDRDRFVLSAGHGSMFMYSILHLMGYGLPMEELRNFRQLGSLTPGHPEFGLTTGVEMTTGPLGAGFATAVGMAVAEHKLGAQFNTPEHSVLDHYTWVLAGDGCLMEGVSAEAASLAGHLGLGKLIVFYDSNHITIEGETDIAFTEDVAKRFEAYGWQILHADGYDIDAISAKAALAKAETQKPTLIILKTVIGYGSPNKAGTHEVHGAPLGGDEVKATKAKLGLDPEKEFQVLPGVEDFVAAKQKEWKADRANWQKTFGEWAAANPEKKALWDTFFSNSLPGSKAGLPAVKWPETPLGSKTATRSASGNCLQALAAAMPNLIGGSADLAPSNNTNLKGLGDYQKDSPLGRNLHFGVREHAMGSMVNGMVLHGGFKVYGATFLVFADYMRPTLRLASIMKIPSVFVLTHDSFWVGEDGPTHQPVETIASMRMIPGLEVLRPADAEETAFAWELTLKKGFGHHHKADPAKPVRAIHHFDASSGPSVLALTRQNLEVFAKPATWKKDAETTGAYVAHAADGADCVVLATGSEVTLAIESAKALAAKGIKVQVVSIISMERFREALNNGKVPSAWIPEGACLFACEAGHYFSWAGIVPEDKFLGISRFGESGPGNKVAEYFGITSAGLTSMVEACVAKCKSGGCGCGKH